MRLTTILFDLDGTLLPMDQEKFTHGYFHLLAKKLSAKGYAPAELVDAIWAGTKAMVKNDGSVSNETVFWSRFTEIYGTGAIRDKAAFDEFYRIEFQEAKAFCGFNPKAAKTVRRIKEMGFRVALATNPIFPDDATKSRIRWTGLEPADFELYTTYENIGYCKPNLDYYREILRRLNASPQECLMVGNDVAEDMIARKLGMEVYLLTDCLINQERRDINQFPRGGFDQLMEILKEEQT